MQFASPQTARTYSDRAVDESWREWAALNLMPAGKDVVDIGCGGGIYSYGFLALGARSVIGVDKTDQYVAEAKSRSRPEDAVVFQCGDATDMRLPADSADIVFERAVIHHLTELEMARNASEAKRLLRAGGLFAVQDRTIEEVESAAPQHWIRATLFELFPWLIDFERRRRPSRRRYSDVLKAAGFREVRELHYDEVRRRYASFDELSTEIRSRKGKSILFELTDDEVSLYCERLAQKARDHPLIERDPWTVWLARK
jgi:SAM-dependent methyltransferase